MQTNQSEKPEVSSFMNYKKGQHSFDIFIPEQSIMYKRNNIHWTNNQIKNIFTAPSIFISSLKLCPLSWDARLSNGWTRVLSLTSYKSNKIAKPTECLYGYTLKSTWQVQIETGSLCGILALSSYLHKEYLRYWPHLNESFLEVPKLIYSILTNYLI
jgi:hypothetical protein